MQTNQLSLVKDQAQRQQEKLSEKFEQAVAFVQNERKQLVQLQEYETDYLNKIKTEQGRWTAENSGRYRQFCHQLSQAIGEQENKLVHAERHLEAMRSELCKQQQKINVLKDVIARGEAEQAQLHNVVIQKEMDEFAGRRSPPQYS